MPRPLDAWGKTVKEPLVTPANMASVPRNLREKGSHVG